MKQFSVKEMKAANPVVKELLAELWRELDTIVDHIMFQGEPQSRNTWNPEDLAAVRESFREYGEWRGQAQGVAYAIAVLSNPYKPDVEAVRTEAMERWEAGEDE